MMLGGRSATFGSRKCGGGARTSHVTCFRHLLSHKWRHESWRHWSEKVGGQYETEDDNDDDDDHDDYQRRTL